ncbi:MAG TPA: Ig-like domain-containing protein, partial [Phnomibacter sp.]|nr:Ig-like domain-containing protein [Phnomibacter sp.]
MLLAGLTLHAQTLVHYRNFNNSATEAALLTPTTQLVAGSSIVHNAGPNSAGTNSQIQITSNTTGQGFEVTNPNARNGDLAGAHLRFNNPLGGNLVFSLPTTGYSNIVVKYGTRRSGQGAHNQVIDYSLDGTTYTNLTTLQPVDGNPTVQTLDFTSISGAANNPNFKIKISFTQGGGGIEGNNRFDNFTLEGEPALTEQLVHYWNFNNASNVANLLTPTVSLIPTASITTVSNGTIATIDLNGTGQNFNLQNLNARNGDEAGTHLRYNDPIGGHIIFALPTTGAKDVVVKYVTRRSGSGAGTQMVEYSIDGSTYKPVTNLTITETPTLITLNFTDSNGVNNNPDFKLRIGFAQGSAGTVGNNRFDNFTLDAKVSITDNAPPGVTFIPANNATGVAGTITPTITFSKDVRLIDNSPITNANVASLLEFKQGNASGPNIAFTATISGRVITVTPAATLSPGTTYYLAVKANVVEGTNDVALAEARSTSFTTAATSFVSFVPNFLSVSEADGSALVSINIT